MGKVSPRKPSETFLNQTAADVLKLCGKDRGIGKALVMLDALLYVHDGFKAQEGENLDSLLMGSVLSARKGNCLSLSLIYSFIAERLNVPLEGVVMPGHFFLRHKPTECNIESTGQGMSMPDLYYQHHFGHGPNPEPPKVVTKKEVLALYLNSLAIQYNLRGRQDQAVMMLVTAIQMMPGESSFYTNLGNTFQRKGDISKAGLAYEKSISIDPYQGETYYNLGLLYFCYTKRYDLARKYGNLARALGARMDPGFRAFLDATNTIHLRRVS